MRRALVSLSALLLLLAAGCSPRTTQAPKEPPLGAAPQLVTARISLIGTQGKPPQPKSFAFADPQHGWVAEGNQLLATQDGGTTWAPLPPAPDVVVTEALISPSFGWIGTDKDLLTLARDGKGWVPRLKGKVSALDFVDALHGWVVIDGQLKGSVDSGATWAPLDSPCQEARFGFQLSFSSPTTGWIVCASQPGAGQQGKMLYRTQDGGESWQLISESGGFGRPPGPVPSGGYLADLFFLDDSHGWMSLARGVIVATADGGQTWHGLPGTQAEVVFPGTVQFFSPTQGLALLQSSGQWVLHATTDGGQSWRPIYPSVRPLAPMVSQMIDARTWVSTGTVADQGALLWTHDSGAHWQQVGSLGKAIDSLTFLDQKQGWALDQDGQVHGTADGGATWKPLAASPPGNEEHLFRLRFITPERGYAISGWGHVYQTTDGGNSFTLVSNSKATMDTAFGNQSTGWRINEFRLEATTDGGKGWAPAGLETRAVALEVVSNEMAWVIGGELVGGSHQSALFGTKDGGKHWTQYELPGLKPSALRFADPQHGLLLDQESRLFATADGGQSWTELN